MGTLTSLATVCGVALGLITTAVQALAGVLLPSATVFLLLLCNDTAALTAYCRVVPKRYGRSPLLGLAY
jgi:Mn2+/Fe2+ NRAMP family transporter